MSSIATHPFVLEQTASFRRAELLAERAADRLVASAMPGDATSHSLPDLALFSSLIVSATALLSLWAAGFGPR